MVNEDVLVDIGFTNNESKIYLALLELGYTNVTSISEKTKLHRTNVYDALKKLVDRGVVSFMKQDNITFYEACNPSVLLGLLKEKEDNLRKVLPQLFLVKKLSENSSDFLLLKGVTSFVESLQDLLAYESEVLVFGMPERALKLLGARVFPFHKERVKRGILCKQIYSSGLRNRVKKGDDLTVTRFNNDEDFGVSSIICDDEILVTDWSNGVLTLKIKSEAVANHYKAQFNVLWEDSSPD